MIFSELAQCTSWWDPLKLFIWSFFNNKNLRILPFLPRIKSPISPLISLCLLFCLDMKGNCRNAKAQLEQCALVALARSLLLSNCPSRLFRVITSSTLMAAQANNPHSLAGIPCPRLSFPLWSSWSVILSLPATSRPIGWGECAGVRERVAGKICLNFSPTPKNQTIKSSLTSIDLAIC